MVKPFYNYKKKVIDRNRNLRSRQYRQVVVEYLSQVPAAEIDIYLYVVALTKAGYSCTFLPACNLR